MVRMGGGSLRSGGTSRVSREAQARICERLGVKFPGATRRWPVTAIPTASPAEPLRALGLRAPIRG